MRDLTALTLCSKLKFFPLIAYISPVPPAHAEYRLNNIISPVGAVAAVKSLPCHISQSAPYISQDDGKN